MEPHNKPSNYIYNCSNLFCFVSDTISNYPSQSQAKPKLRVRETTFSTCIHCTNGNGLLISALNTHIHSKIRQIVFSTTLGIGIVVGLVTVVAGVRYKWSFWKAVLGVVTFGSMCILMLHMAVASIPLVIFTTIYPVEMISTVSFVIAMFVGTSTGAVPLKLFVHVNYKFDKPSKKERCYIKCYSRIVFIFIHITVPFAFYLLLIMYLSLLKSLSESPISQFLKLILSFVPPNNCQFPIDKKKMDTATPNKSQHDLYSIKNSSSGHSQPTTHNRNQPERLRSRNNDSNLSTQV